MQHIGNIVEGIVARIVSSRKGPTAGSRRPSSGGGKRTADPRAEPELPDKPAMGETESTSLGATRSDDSVDVSSSTGRATNYSSLTSRRLDRAATVAARDFVGCTWNR